MSSPDAVGRAVEQGRRRLSPLDAAFLDAEIADRNAILEIAAIAVLQGSPPPRQRFVESLRPRLSAVSRHRQRVRRVPFDLGRPWWEDTHVDFDYHVKRAALPAPGDDTQLADLVGMVMSDRLDHDRPLWQCWIVEGLAGGRWALLIRAHHSLADAVGGFALLAAVLAAEPPRQAAPEQAESPGPAPPPGPGELWRAVTALGGLAAPPLRQARRCAEALRRPDRVAKAVAATARGLATLARVLVPVAPSSLSGPIGRQRRYRIGQAPLRDVTAVARRHGVTVNDVVLAAVSGAFRELLLRRGERVHPHLLRALVPVSARTARRPPGAGNQLSWLLPLLPVDVADPVERLSVVHERLAGLKHSQEAQVSSSLLGFARQGPFPPLSWAVRTAARLPQRNIVTVVTNIPGPRQQFRLFGDDRIVRLLPYVPIGLRLRTGIAVLSYGDTLSIGVTADAHSVPDADALARGVEDGIAELVRAGPKWR
ncbi:acyltransferase, WS/DGAT/MGAT [Saccharomonospora marina XMU15]|uniref:Diacylglycerol O-acyltransferase n=1 Tax=Saccharomonospora marina XMU15 TaxID=882083 RepID=H5WZT5_9PSEU|nr:wax ester/triacylglycerol synthase family O-acyltransferase [Saccharomonospora marina]EHR51872.1 acyltransferase, WS/DGAT/MGAT [Saccharomonospora marina XMU15]